MYHQHQPSTFTNDGRVKNMEFVMEVIEPLIHYREKGYLHWHDVGLYDTPLEAGVGFVVPKEIRR